MHVLGIDAGGTKYQLWAVPVSLRARKRAARQQARAAAEGDSSGRTSLVTREPVRASSDQIMGDLRELQETRAQAASAQGEPGVRWAWEIMGPAAAGAVLLAVLIALG